MYTCLGSTRDHEPPPERAACGRLVRARSGALVLLLRQPAPFCGSGALARPAPAGRDHPRRALVGSVFASMRLGSFWLICMVVAMAPSTLVWRLGDYALVRLECYSAVFLVSGWFGVGFFVVFCADSLGHPWQQPRTTPRSCGGLGCASARFAGPGGLRAYVICGRPAVHRPARRVSALRHP